MFFDYANRGFMQQRQQSNSGSRTSEPVRSRSSQPAMVRRATGLIGRQVKINRGGPDMVEGRLAAIPADYLVVSTNDGIVYVNAAHVKSITETGQSGGTTGNRSRSRSASFITASSFNSLLSKLRHQFVQINRGGPEKIDGFLAEISSDSLIIVVDREIIRIPLFHIKTVNVSGKGNNKSGSGNNNKSGSSNKSNNKSGSRSGGNRSGGRSGGRSGNRSGRRSGNRS